MELTITATQSHSHTIVLTGWRQDVSKVQKLREVLESLVKATDIVAYRLDRCEVINCQSNDVHYLGDGYSEDVLMMGYHHDLIGEFAVVSVDLFGAPNQLASIEKQFAKEVAIKQKEKAK